MNPREKLMLGVTAAVLVAIVSFYLIRFFIARSSKLREELARTTRVVDSLKSRESERETWLKRDAWLNQKLSVIGDPDVANKMLREYVLDLAKKHTVTVEQPAPGKPNPQANYTSLSIRLDATAPWDAMFQFLRELQGPEKFVAIENCELKVKPEDKTKLRASLTVARWFAPK